MMREKHVKHLVLLLFFLVGVVILFFCFFRSGSPNSDLPLAGRESSGEGAGALGPKKNGAGLKPLVSNAASGEKGNSGLTGARIRLEEKSKRTVLRARPLEVRLFCVKGGKEVQAPGGTVFASPSDFEREDNPAGKGSKGNVLSPWSFPCDRNGRAFLPLAGLAGKGRAGGVSFEVWGESKDGKYASPPISLGLDDFGRYLLEQSYPTVYLKGALKLRMREKAAVEIAVKDGYGKPVEGVPVGIFHYSQPLNRAGAALFPLRLGKTGKEGVCLLSLPMGERKGLWTLLTRRIAAGFPFPLSHLERWFKKITLKEGGKKDVILRMPPTGEVVVGIENWKEIEKEKGGRRFWVWAVNAGWGKRAEWSVPRKITARHSFLKKFCKEVEGGRVVFPYVEIGLKLKVFLFEEGRSKYTTKSVNGPSFPGDKVTLFLPRPDPDPVVSGVLLGPAGKPFRKGKIFVYEGDEGNGLKFDFAGQTLFLITRTDGSGRFRIPLHGQGPDPKYPRTHLRIMPEGDLGEKWRPFWVVPLPGPFTEAERFLGTFKIQIPPLLVEGTVADASGKPVEGAEVRCYRPFNKSGETTWQRVFSATSISGPGGNWFVKGFWQWEKLKVMAVKKGMGSSDQLVVRPGSRGLKLLLYGEGDVEAKILVPKRIYLERRMVKPQLVPRHLWVHGPNQNASKKVFPDGRVVWKNLIPGTYDFRVCAQGDPARPLVLVPGIQVRPGKVNKDPRIQGVDLWGKLEEFTVIAKDPSGRALDPSRMWIENKAGAGSMPAPSRKGRVLLRRIGDAPEIEVFYPGYKSRRVKCKGRVVEIVLEPLQRKHPSQPLGGAKK